MSLIKTGLKEYQINMLNRARKPVKFCLKIKEVFTQTGLNEYQNIMYNRYIHKHTTFPK
jgi:hypothetical protein